MKRLYIIILALLILYGVYFVYLGPRLTGDSFGSALIRLDTHEMANYLCEDTTVNQVINSIGSTGDQVTLLLTGLLGEMAPSSVIDQVSQALVPRTSYNLLNGHYVFSLMLRDELDVLGFKISAGLATPDMMLYIRRGIFRACITSN
jgi:hypothetical protein